MWCSCVDGDVDGDMTEYGDCAAFVVAQIAPLTFLVLKVIVIF